MIMAGPTKDKQTAAQKATRFDGEKSNRNQRSNSKVRIQKSKLRITAEKLREIEPTALENIKNSVEGKDVEAKMLSTSQWVITSIIALDRAAAGEETSLTKLRLEGKRDDDEEQEVAEIVKLVPKTRLELNWIDPEAK
jgi:hypothetical protein